MDGTGDAAGPNDTLAVRFLEEGGQPATEVAGWLADFLTLARRSLDLAFYDIRLSDGPAALLRQALADRIAAGVEVRLVFDAGDKPQTAADLDLRGVDPAPGDTAERVAALGLPGDAVRAVHGLHALMHHKYVVRDGTAIWTGSLNLTDDSMSRMENVVLTLESGALGGFYARDFAELWRTAAVMASGAFPTRPAPLRYDGQWAVTDVDFSPGQGRRSTPGWRGGSRRRGGAS